MKRKPVRSSDLVSVGYDKKAEVLEIEFKNSVWQYADVPRKVYVALMSSPSQGRYFRKHISGKYKAEKV